MHILDPGYIAEKFWPIVLAISPGLVIGLYSLTHSRNFGFWVNAYIAISIIGQIALTINWFYIMFTFTPDHQGFNGFDPGATGFDFR